MSSFVSYLLIILLVSGAGVGYFYYTQNKTDKLVNENAELRYTLSVTNADLNACIDNRERQENEIDKLINENNKAEKEIKRYLEVFKRHDINKLAAAKPGLVERAVNNGTKEVLKELENETATK